MKLKYSFIVFFRIIFWLWRNDFDFFVKKPAKWIGVEGVLLIRNNADPDIPYFHSASMKPYPL